MVRLDRTRVILIILVICSSSVSVNLFFKSRLPKVGKTADKHLHLQGGSNKVKESPQTEKEILLKPDPVSSGENLESKADINITVPSEDRSEGARTSNTSNTLTSDVQTEKTEQANVSISQDNSINWCPDNPPFLEGALASMQQEVRPQELIAWYPGFEMGGRLRPAKCTPRQRLAIIIPYRNRYHHLHIMMNNLVPILQRQQADVTFFIIEQAPPDTFNRGALLNVGFLEAEKTGNFDCYIFHDVDLIPLNDRNLYRCGDNPRHFAVSMNKFGYQLAYKGYFGGVVGFTKKQYITINGCSNIYFGWGGEDDDMLARLRNKNYTMVRYDTLTARYDMIEHHRDKGNEENPFRTALLNDAWRRQDIEGLNTTRYKVNSVRIERLYTWITVSLNMTEILQTAPDFSLKLMKNQMTRTTAAPKPKRKIRKRVEKESPKVWSAQLSLTFSLVTPKVLPLDYY